MNILSKIKWPWRKRAEKPVDQTLPSTKTDKCPVCGAVGPKDDYGFRPGCRPVEQPSEVAAAYCSRCEAWHTAQEPCLPATSPKIGKLHTDPSAAVAELAERMKLRKSSR